MAKDDGKYNEYSEMFYFFQYQFYIRSRRHLERPFTSKLRDWPVYRFLQSLALDYHSEEFRWRTLDKSRSDFRPPANFRKPKKNSTRPKMKMIKSCLNGTILYPAKNESLRCRLFFVAEIPQGHDFRHFRSMAKILWLYDFVCLVMCNDNALSYNNALWKIATLELNEVFIEDIFPATSPDYLGILSKQLLGRSLMSYKKEELSSLLGENLFGEKQKKSFTTSSLPKKTDDRWYDQKREIYKRLCKYYEQASQLIALAGNLKFKEYLRVYREPEI